MVLWSYLLLTAPAAGSLERVLAPLTDDESGADLPATSAAMRAPYPVADSDASPAAPLVEPGVDELDLLSELEHQLAQRLGPQGRLRLIPMSTLPALPQASTVPEVELLDHPARLGSGSILLRYRLLDDGRLIGTHATSFRVQVLADVWVPVRRMSPGDALSATGFTAREVDLVREPRAVPADDSIFDRYEIVRVTAPGQVLTWNDVALRALVHKGEIVDVIAQEGLLSISMKGQATRSGALGEVVTIRNLESKREFSAEVIDENKVRVHF